MIPKSVERYLAKQCDLTTTGPGFQPAHRTHQVVIPCFREFGEIDQLLNQLTACPVDVILVVNEEQDASAETHAENLAVIEFAKQPQFMNVRVVDRVNHPYEVGKGGVGAARKTGLDYALLRNAARNAVHAVVVSLDADVKITRDALLQLIDDTQSGSVTLARFEHPLDRPEIITYEAWMRWVPTALKKAGSPYSFTALGSRFACTTADYATVGGMSRRQAAEDYHFIQKFVKTFGASGIRHSDALVVPSSRSSSRVPFGTGPAIRDIAAGHTKWDLWEPSHAFETLKSFLDVLPDFYEGEPQLPPGIVDYLENAEFRKVVDGVRENAPNQESFMHRMHAWFDGIRTMRFINSVKRVAAQNPSDALVWLGAPPDLTSPEILQWLRERNATDPV